MKKCLSLFLCLLLILALASGVSAESPKKIVDDAGLFSDSEIQSLEEKAEELAGKYDIDVVIVTVWSLDGKTSEAYADDYFDYNGYGIGNNYSGVLFLLSMEYRDWAITTHSDGQYALTDYGIQTIFSDIAGHLSKDEYYDAFDLYLNRLEDYFRAFANGDPIDGWADSYTGPGSYEHGTQEEIVYYPSDNGINAWQIISNLFIALIIGAVVAALVLMILRSQMKTSVPQSGAKFYLKSGSYNLRQQQDMFLYSNISKTRRSEDSGGHSSRSGGHSGGGSSSHTSSSGRSHGGGHGKF